MHPHRNALKGHFAALVNRELPGIACEVVSLSDNIEMAVEAQSDSVAVWNNTCPVLN